MNRIKIAYFDIDGALVDFYAGQSAPPNTGTPSPPAAGGEGEN